MSYLRKLFLLLLFLHICYFVKAQENYELLRKSMVSLWGKPNKIDSVLWYAKKVKIAANTEFGSGSWQYLRALRDVARVNFEQKNYPAALNELLTAYNKFKDINDAAFEKTNGAVLDLLLATYLAGTDKADSAAFFAHEQIAFTKRHTGASSRAMINNLRGIANEFQLRFGTLKAQPFFNLAAEARGNLFGRRSAELTKGIDSILFKFKGQVLAERRQALYLVYDSTYSYKALHKLALSPQFRNTWDELYNTQELTDAALKTYGDTSTAFISALSQLGIVYGRFLGEYDIAAFCLLKAKAILEQNNLENTVKYLQVMFDLGDISGATGIFQQASAISTNYIKLAARLGGEKGKNYAEANERAGLMYFNFNRYAEHYYKMASGSLVQAMLLNSALYGEGSLNYAVTLANIGHVHLKYAYYDFAVSYYLKAYKKLKEHPDQELYMLCRGISAAYDARNEPAKRNIWLQEAINVQRLLGGENQYSFLRDLINKANSSIELKDWSAAAAEIKKIKELIASSYKDEQTIQASLRTLVATYELAQDKDAGLDELILQNLKMYANSSKFKKDDPDVIKSITADYKLLANIYIHQQRFDLAKNANSEAWKINGFDTNQVFILKQRAQIMDGLNDRDSAIYYYKTAIERLGNAGWKDKLSYFEWKMEFVSLYEKAGRFVEAEVLMRDALQKIKELMVNNMAGFSEKEKGQYNRILQEYLYRYYNLQLQLKPGMPEITANAYNFLVQTKGLLLSSADFLVRTIANSSDNLAKDRLARLRSLRKELAIAYEQNNKDIDSLEQLAFKSERELSLNTPAYQGFQQQHNSNLSLIRQRLKPDQGLIEFVEFPYYKNGSRTDSVCYGAFVIRKDLEFPEYVVLQNYEQVRSFLQHQGVSGRGITEEVASQKEDVYQTLYNLVWAPVSPSLKELKTLYIAADGIVNGISFMSLQDLKGAFLMDKYILHFVLGGRALLDLKEDTRLLPGQIALFGGADFDARQQYTAAMLTGNRSIAENRKGNSPWGYLPGTLKEINMIKTVLTAKNWKAANYSGIAASEANIKKLSGKNAPAVLHIATHGFYFPSKTKDNAENAMLRSGLLLSSANKAWLGASVEDGAEDGILTAFEIGNMDLQKTRLMILSACETGIGENVTGEGVYGLQRAIKQAGVDKMIVSLWPVPDKETAEMMQLFYARLSVENSISAAFRSAQAAMRKRYAAKPALWAGFVLIE